MPSIQLGIYHIATPEHQLLPEIFAETFRSYYPKLHYAALQIKTGNKSLEFANNRMCRKKQISGTAILIIPISS